MVFLEKKGYLLKRNKKDLVKTYFVLRDCFLFWFDGDKSTEPKGAISTPRCQVFSSDTSFSQQSNRAKLTVFIITPDGDSMELVADTIAEKDEWIGKIRDSCEHVRQFFDGESTTGFNKLANGEALIPQAKEGWFRMNGKKIYCVAHQGLLVWYPEEPTAGPVDADKIRGSINLSCCGFALLDEILEPREGSEKKDKEQHIVILPPLGLSYYVLTPRSGEDVGKWMEVLASNSGFRSVPQPASLASKHVDENMELRKTGWLAKRKDSKNRWFVVQSNVLMWFDKEQQDSTTNNCRGNVSLGFGSYVGRDYSPDGGAGEDSGSFVVYSPIDGAFKLSARSKGDADEWMYVINECISINNKSLLQLTRTAKEKTGWLSRRGKKHWFSLRNNHLMWYADEQVDGRTSLVKGSMMVEGLIVTPSDKGNTYYLTLSSKGSELLLTAVDKKDRDEWIDSIKKAQLFIQEEHQRHILLTEKYFDEFMGLLVRNKSMAVLIALCKCYESEQLIATITALYLSEDRHWPLLSAALQTEIENCFAEPTLFRTDSIATKTTRAYFKLIGSQYLQSTLIEVITDVMNNPEGYEVDPTKAESNEDVVINCERLRYAAQRILDKVVTSLSYVPPQMRQFFANLRSMVAKKFPNSQVKAVGAFLFLRFLCPAIFSPDGFGLVAESPDDAARRALVLIAKVLQNTANGVQFGGKEEYMAPLNSFVTDNVSVLYHFFDQVSSDPPNIPAALSRQMSTIESRQYKARYLAVIVRTLNASIEYLQKRDDVPKEELKRLKDLLNENITSTESGGLDEDAPMGDSPPPSPEDAPVAQKIPLPPPPPIYTLRRLPDDLPPLPTVPLPPLPTTSDAFLPTTSDALPPRPLPVPVPAARPPKVTLAAALSSKLAARTYTGPPAVPTVIPNNAVQLLHTHPPPSPSSSTSAPPPSSLSIPDLSLGTVKRKKSAVFASSVPEDAPSASTPTSPSSFIPNLINKAKTFRKSAAHTPMDPEDFSIDEGGEERGTTVTSKKEKQSGDSPKKPKKDTKDLTMAKSSSVADLKKKDSEETRRSFGNFAELAEEVLHRQNTLSPPRVPSSSSSSPRPPPPISLSPNPVSSPPITTSRAPPGSYPKLPADLIAQISPKGPPKPHHLVSVASAPQLTLTIPATPTTPTTLTTPTTPTTPLSPPVSAAQAASNLRRALSPPPRTPLPPTPSKVAPKKPPPQPVARSTPTTSSSPATTTPPPSSQPPSAPPARPPPMAPATNGPSLLPETPTSPSSAPPPARPPPIPPSSQNVPSSSTPPLPPARSQPIPPTTNGTTQPDPSPTSPSLPPPPPRPVPTRALPSRPKSAAFSPVSPPLSSSAPALLSPLLLAKKAPPTPQRTMTSKTNSK